PLGSRRPRARHYGVVRPSENRDHANLPPLLRWTVAGRDGFLNAPGATLGGLATENPFPVEHSPRPGCAICDWPLAIGYPRPPASRSQMRTSLQSLSSP